MTNARVLQTTASVEYALGSRYTTLTTSPAAFVDIGGPPVQGRAEVYGDGRLLTRL